MQVAAKRYAHKKCAEERNVEGIVTKVEIKKTEEELDLLQLRNYIDEIWNKDADYPAIGRQLQRFTGPEFNFTYKGIHRALRYYYEITHHAINNKYKHLGIIPYVYNKAQEYYGKIEKARKQNEQVGEIEKEIKEIHIPIPQTTVKKRQLFTFFEEDI